MDGHFYELYANSYGFFHTSFLGGGGGGGMIIFELTRLAICSKSIQYLEQ